MSPTTHFFAHLFTWLDRLSLANLLLGAREQVFDLRTPVERVRVTIWRGRLIELYVASWLAIETVIAVLAYFSLAKPLWLIGGILGYRTVEIVQATLNINVFWALRIHGLTPRTASLARTFVLTLLNFGELMLCFGGIYASMPEKLVGLGNPINSYYFSLVTQLTIGYGDIRPAGAAKLVVAGQGLASFILAVVVLARLVALLPGARPVLRSK